MRDRRLIREDDFKRKYRDHADDYYGPYGSDDEKYDRPGKSEYRGYTEEHYDDHDSSHYGPGFHRENRLPDNRDLNREGYVQDRHSDYRRKQEYENRSGSERYDRDLGSGRNFFDKAEGRIKDAWHNWREENLNGSHSLPEHRRSWNDDESDYVSERYRPLRQPEPRYQGPSSYDDRGDRRSEYTRDRSSEQQSGDSGRYLDYYPDYGTMRTDRSYGYYDIEDFGHSHIGRHERIGRGRRRNHFW